ncbi:prolyl oligopeptidase, partial [Suillus brevipes Sb2]
VNSASFSPDGTRLVSGSDDETIRLWDVGTGKAVGEPLEGHTSWVSSVSFSRDGTRIVSGSVDMTVRLWDAMTGQPIGASHDDRRSTFAVLDDDGWMMGPNRRLVFWVPPASRKSLYNSSTALVLPRGGPELDLSRMVHGTRWQQCYEK